MENVNYFAILREFNQEILKPINAKCLIVGSMALHALGVTEAEPKDIDIEVEIASYNDRNIFKALALASGNDFFKKAATDVESYMENVTWENKPYIFKWKEVVFNVWVVKEFSHEYIHWERDMYMAKPMSVIKKKMAYKREKDRAFMKDLIGKLIKLI